MRALLPDVLGGNSEQLRGRAGENAALVAPLWLDGLPADGCTATSRPSRRLERRSRRGPCSTSLLARNRTFRALLSLGTQTAGRGIKTVATPFSTTLLVVVMACGCGQGERLTTDAPVDEAAAGGIQFQPGAPATPSGEDTDSEPVGEPVGEADGPTAPGLPNGPTDTHNAPPTGGSAILMPVNVVEGDTITCTAVSAVDPDGDAVTWTFAWLVNGDPVPGQTADTLHSDWFNKGDTVLCIATPWDNHAAGPAVTSKTSATVWNTPPQLKAAALSPAEITLTEAFTCSYSGWLDPDPADKPEVMYEWQKMSPGEPQWLVGPSSSTLSGSLLSPGDTVRCRATPVDDESAGAPAWSDPGTVSDVDTCTGSQVQLDLSVAHIPPSILLVVDRSGSMLDKWSQTKNAVGAVLADLPPDAESGLLLYPSNKSCSVANGPQVPFGAGQANAIVEAMTSAGTGGSTPMGRAMKEARIYLETAAGTANTTVVLAADGKPSDTCLMDCTDCDCTDNATCLWCADLIDCTYREVRREVELLADLGIQTFVIGYAGGFGASGFLEDLAHLGGTADVGASPFYDAADGSALGAALSEITANLDACSAKVDTPKGFLSVSVKVNGQSTDDAEWNLDADGTLHLFGDACTGAAAPGGTVDVHFQCPEQ